MSKGKLIIYWDYELQKGADVSTVKYTDGINDHSQTEFILKILRPYDIKTCFAVLGYAAEKGNLPYHAPEQIREMAEQGHEVGSHTFNHKRISQLNAQQLREELTKSKETIEKVSRTKCTAFVPPWDKPQYLLNKAIDFYPGTFILRRSVLSFDDICTILKNSGYRSYRTCPLLSRFDPFKLSVPFWKKSIVCIPSKISNGFGLEAKKLVQKAVEKKGLAVVYAHPRGLAHPGLENKQHFERFVQYIGRLKETQKLDIILPRELVIK